MNVASRCYILTVPAVDLDDKNVLCFNRESPKSQTCIIAYIDINGYWWPSINCDQEHIPLHSNYCQPASLGISNLDELL